MRLALRALLAVVLVLSFVPVADAAVSFVNDNTPITAAGPASSLSGSQTVTASGSNLVAIIDIFWDDQFLGDNISAVTYGGVAATALGVKVDNTGSGRSFIRTYRVINPPTGSNTLSVTWTAGNSINLYAYLRAYNGVDQTTPVRAGSYTTFSGNTSAGGTASLVVPSAVGDRTFTSVGAVATALTTTQTLRRHNDSTGSAVTGFDDAAGAATVTHTWDNNTAAALGIGIIGASLQASAGAADTTPPTTPGTPTYSAITSQGMTISWTASTDNIGVTAYGLERCSGAGCSNFASIASPTTNNFNDTGLAANTSFTYRVRAFDAANNTSGASTGAAQSTLNTQSRILTWTPTAPFTQDGFAIYRCITAASTCTPSTAAVTLNAGPNAVSVVDPNGGLPTSCYIMQATLAGTSGSGFSNLACATGTVTNFTLTIATAGTGNGTTIPSGPTTVTSGTVVSLTATPDARSDFQGWINACAGGTVTVNASTSCVATFNQQNGTFAYLGHRGSNATKTLSNTIGVKPNATISQTNLLIVRAVTDNTSTTSGQTGEHVSVTDTTGNQYVKLGEVTRSAGSAGNGVTVSLWASRPFSSLTTASTVNLTTATARVANSIALEEFSLAASTTFATNPISNTTSNGTSTTPSAVLSGLSSVARLFLAGLGIEGPSTETYTQSVNYASGTTANGTTGGATTSNLTSRFGFLRQTVTGDTFSPTLGTSENWGLVYVSLATATAQNASSVTLTNSGTGSGTLTGAGTFYNGTTVTIVATPNNQSQFVAWQNVAGDPCASTTNNTVTIQSLTQNTTCNAVFTLGVQPPTNFNLTIATAGTGNGTTSPPVGVSVVASGTVVNLVATPASNSSFGGWSPSICSSGSFTMSADTTCTATFTLLPLATMTTVNAGTGQGTTTGAGTFFVGQTAVLTATPAVGSVFSGWSGSPGCTGTASPLNVVMDSSKTCTATYTAFTGPGPTGTIVVSPYRQCAVAYVVSVSTGGPVANVVWKINNVTKRSTAQNGVQPPTIQTVAPYTFTQSNVTNGSLVTALVTDVSGQTSVFGPVTVACP